MSGNDSQDLVGECAHRFWRGHSFGLERESGRDPTLIFLRDLSIVKTLASKIWPNRQGLTQVLCPKRLKSSSIRVYLRGRAATLACIHSLEKGEAHERIV